MGAQPRGGDEKKHEIYIHTYEGKSAKCNPGKWELSRAAVTAMKDYQAKFPLIFSGLTKVGCARELGPIQAIPSTLLYSALILSNNSKR